MTSEKNLTQTEKLGFWQRAWPYFTIVLVTLVAHGFLLLIDWTFWEGARNYFFIISRDPAQMSAWILQGVPIIIPYLLFLGAFSDVFFASNFLAFLSFLAIGLLIYQICQTSSLMRRGVSLSIALFTVLYPVFQFAMINSVTAYILGYAIFLAGVLFALRMEYAAGWRCWAQHGLALLLLLVGMNFLQSLYVFYFGFLLFYFFFLLKREGLDLGEGLIKLVPRRLDFIFLPFLGWGIRNVFYNSSTEYNMFRLNPQQMLQWVNRFLNFGFWDPVFMILVRYWWLLLLAFGICALLFCYLPGKFMRIADLFGPRFSHWVSLEFGFVLFVMAIFPYVVVGKGITKSIFSAIPFDPDTRHAFLLGLPVAVFLMTFARWLILKRRPLWMALGTTLLLVYTAGFAAILIQNYADWQMRAIKDHSFIAQLAEMDEVDQYPLLWVYDEFPAGGIQFVEGRGFYAGEELKLIASFAWPNGSLHTLIDDNYRGYSEQDFADHNMSYFAPGAGLENCQAELILRRNPSAGSNLNVLAHYYYYKFIRGEDVLQGYLKGNQRLTLVYFKPSEVQPVEGCP